MKLTLYHAPLACSLAPHLALIEAGAQFDIHPVNLAQGQQRSADYLQLNPKGKVPLLLIDGEPLSENVAILTWIARNFPAARLLPKDQMLELHAISLMSWFASAVHPALTPMAVPQRFCDLAGTENNVKACAQQLLLQHYRHADNLLAGRSWFFEDFGVTDAYYFWCFRRGMQLGVNTSEFLNCTKHFDRVRARPSVEVLEVYETYMNTKFSIDQKNR